MTFLFVMNLGLAWGAIAPPAFKAFWLVNLNQQVGPTPQQPSPE